MSILTDALTRRVVNPQLWAQGLDGRGSTIAGETVTPEKAFGIAVAWSCATLLADTISSLPVDVFRKRPSGVRQLVEPTPQLIAKPSLIYTAREWRYQAVISLAFWGNGYGLVIDRDGTGFPTGVEVLNPDKLRVDRASDLDQPNYHIDRRPVDREKVLHLRRYMRPGSVVGLAPLLVHKETFGLGLAARKFAAAWFGDGAHPSALLINDDSKGITEEQAKTAKQRFVEAIRGRREPAALGNGWKYQSIQTSPADSEMAETFDRVGIEVCQAFRVPPEMVGLAAKGSSVTYANREQRSIDFLTYSLTPWLAVFEDMWTANIPTPQFARFNTGALLRSDLVTRYRSHDVAIRMGLASVNERRALEDLEPIEGGDEFLWPPYRAFPLERDQDE